jgi:ribulose-phosphate 3-epimerase
LHRVLEQIRARNAKAGVALNPATPVESVAEVLGEIDFLSVLSADPGIEEQAFIARSTAKVQAAARARDERGLGLAIQVEGGIGFDHIDELMRVGADILVVGSAIFDNDDPKAKLKEMIRLACAGRQTTPRSVGKELSPVSRGAAEDL